MTIKQVHPGVTVNGHIAVIDLDVFDAWCHDTAMISNPTQLGFRLLMTVLAKMYGVSVRTPTQTLNTPFTTN